MHLMNEYIVRGAFGGAFQPFDDPDEIRRVMTGVLEFYFAPTLPEPSQRSKTGSQKAPPISSSMPGCRASRWSKQHARIRYLADKVAPHAPNPTIPVPESGQFDTPT